MAAKHSEILESLAVNGMRLRALFRRQGDLFLHSIERPIERDAATPLLEACLTRGTVGAVPPPWQELVRHRLPDGREALLLTGAGDGRYWSLSVEALRRDGRSLLAFDVATRGGAAQGRPALGYRLAPATRIVETTRAATTLAAANSRVVVASLPINRASAEEPSCRLTVDDGRLWTEPEGAEQPTNGAWRWRFELALQEESTASPCGSPSASVVR